MVNVPGIKYFVKFEYRNPNFETISNVQNSNVPNKVLITNAEPFRTFEHLDFEFVSDFDIRI
ncbi:MAG: hypothetical protein A2Z25_24560 [Planctomycetes bacterium RBG_16_55_9]|nr:MAG: hypothetical protein A2Z25_24560 [Planctomycetes bacterium RBG_16_55_9]